MGIAAQIGQHLFWSAAWCLGVDHPIEAPEFAKATREGLRFGKVGEFAEELQRAGAEGILQFLHEQSAEQPREHAHRQEEAGRQATHRVPSTEGPPPGTTQWTWG